MDSFLKGVRSLFETSKVGEEEKAEKKQVDVKMGVMEEAKEIPSKEMVPEEVKEDMVALKKESIDDVGNEEQIQESVKNESVQTTVSVERKAMEEKF